MSEVEAAYKAYREFPAFRDHLWQQELENRKGGAAELREEKRELEAEKRRILAEINAKIATINLELIHAGEATTIGEQRKDFDTRMRVEKTRRRTAFHKAVRAAHEAGMSLSQMQRACGVSSPNTFSAALKADMGFEEETMNVAPVCAWEYHDHSAVHRYALSTDRAFVKLHGLEGEVAYFTYPDCGFYAGDAELLEKLDKNRVQVLAQLLDGTYDGEVKHRHNKYRDL